MSMEFIAIISATIALAGLILNGQCNIRKVLGGMR